jgi:hypothetical protein
MSILQSDLLIRVAITSFLDEIRANTWLIQDALSDLITDPLLNEVYGQKEINNAIEWFQNNKIHVSMKLRRDTHSFPCVTIALGSSSENDSEATLADQSTESEFLSQEDIEKPIPYIIPPFPAEYVSGVLIPPPTTDLSNIQAGMLIVDPKTGKAYSISGLSGAGIMIEGSPVLTASEYGVIPHYRYWKARRERARFRETYSIGCHVAGESAPILWLHTMVLYGLLRYRETLLERRGFDNSSVSSSDMIRNDAFQMPEDVTSRFITVTGTAENTWLKSPKRTIEKVKEIPVLESNLTTSPIVNSDKTDPWTTVAPQSEKPKKTKIIRKFHQK